MTKQGYFQRWFVVPSDEKRIKPASYRDMLRYATTFDYLLLFVGVTSAFLNGVTYPLNTLAFQGIINYLTDAQNEYDNGDIDKDKLTYGINKYAWMYFGIGCVIFVLTFLGMSALYILCEKQVQQIRKRYLQSILNQDVEWFDQNEVGALTHKMTSNVDKIKSGASDKLIILLQAAGALFCGIGIAFYLSWRLAIIVMIIVPIVIINLYCAAKAVTAAIHKEMSAYSAAGAVAEEVLHGIRTVTAFNAQSFEVLRYETHLKRGKTAGIQKAAITSFFNGLYNVILFGAMGVCFWYGTQLVVWGYAKPGTAFSAFWAIVMGAIRIGMALPQISVILGAKVAAAELFEIIDRKPKLNLSEDYGEKLMNVEGDITFSNVGFSYPTRPEVSVLNDVSFSVKHGETVALVGHSGCGKSTIINLLLRYYDPSSGNISIDGVNLNEFNVQWLRKVIGVVSQDHVVFHATIAENLRYGNPDASEADLVTACRTANAHEFIEKLPKKYDTFIGDGGIKLSGGQKQRLSIARILLRQPKILLLDEATSALDTESEKLVQSALDIASSGRTTVTVAHRLSTVRNADKILVFDFGKIIEIGNHDELMESQGTYYKMVQAQQMKTEIKDDVDYDEMDEIELDSELNVKDAMKSNLSLHKRLPNALADDKTAKPTQALKHSATLCTIIRFARPELSFALMGLLMAMLQGAMWPAYSLIYGRLFLVLSGDMSKAVHDAAIYGIILAVVGLLGGIATFASGSFLGTVGESVAMRLRLGVYKNILRQDCEYFDQRNHGVGVLTARLAEDASNVQAAIDQRLAEVLEGLTTLTLGTVIGFVVSWRMAPFCIAITLAMFFVQTRIGAYLKSRGVKDAEIAEETNKITAESIENVKTIQALTHQSNTIAKFEEASILPFQRARMRGLIHAISAAISQSNIWISFWACYLFGLFLIKEGTVSPYEVFQTIEALNMPTVLITNTIAYFPEYIKARISMGIMFDMMRTEPMIDSASNEGTHRRKNRAPKRTVLVSKQQGFPDFGQNQPQS
uniref:Multidrug resistance protein 1 n=1 Tax=Panagrellus redivivus TaxID=6233 RepID=A0A7E5A008_PANRE